LSAGDLLAVSVIAALPTAQNVFSHGYDRGVITSRDTILVAPLLSAPMILAITQLGPVHDRPERGYSLGVVGAVI
jgi:hypothetical protein